MKIISILITLTLFFTVIAPGQGTTGNFAIVDTVALYKHHAQCLGKQFGQFTINTSGSTVFSNANFANKIVFVNFWFEGCHPCMAELEGFNKLSDTLKNKQNFLFVSFTFDPDSTIQKIKDEYHIQYKIFHIEQADCYRLNFGNGFPASFVLDKNGVIKYFKIGGKIDKEQSAKEVMTQIYPAIIKQL